MTNQKVKYLKQIVRSFLLCYTKKAKNYYNTKFNKNVLVSYIIPAPSNSKEARAHTNHQEATEILKLFRDLHYNIDIYHPRYRRKIDYMSYDLIFGFGEPFNNSFYNKCNATRVYYGTGAHVCYSNRAELSRIRALQKRKGRLLKPRRAVPKTWSASTMLSDAIIVIGNEFTMNTYRKQFKGPIYNIPVTAFNFFPGHSIDREWKSAKKNFLWFGGKGLVHKGLDITIEAFHKISGMKLHICGPMENDFMSLYNKELFHSSNITYHDLVDVASEKFRKILRECAFQIFPSCSEGQSSSVATAMMAGCIPIITRQTGIDIGDFGFLLSKATVGQIIQIAKYVATLSDHELATRAKKTSEYAQSTHSISNFRAELNNALRKILAERKP